MVKNNKVINKVLLPKALALVILITFASGAGFYVTQDPSKPNTSIVKPDMLLIGLVALLVIFACMDVYSDYKKGEKIASLITRRYLKNEMENYPELKQFEKVIYDSKAIKNISALIFNSLRPSERKVVAQIVLDAYRDLKEQKHLDPDERVSLKDMQNFLKDTRDKVIPIIKGHAMAHPEFIDNIYSAMASANNTIYIMSKNSIQQNIK